MQAKAPFDFTAHMGIWNGKQFLFEQPSNLVLFLAELFWRYGLGHVTKLQDLNKKVMEKFNEVYDFLEKHITYGTGQELYTDLRLFPLTQITMEE